jgi:hypothetical protein
MATPVRTADGSRFLGDGPKANAEVIKRVQQLAGEALTARQYTERTSLSQYQVKQALYYLIRHEKWVSERASGSTEYAYRPALSVAESRDYTLTQGKGPTSAITSLFMNLDQAIEEDETEEIDPASRLRHAGLANAVYYMNASKEAEERRIEELAEAEARHTMEMEKLERKNAAQHARVVKKLERELKRARASSRKRPRGGTATLEALPQ